MNKAKVLLFVSICIISSCRNQTPLLHDQASNLEALALSPFIGPQNLSFAPITEEVSSLLKSKKDSGQIDHLGLLVEYGLRVHWHYLKNTNLSRELLVKENIILSELIRIANIPEYTTAHEAGWLNSQFDGEFKRTGWSSYQIYVWVKENQSTILSDNVRFHNYKRIMDLIITIDKSEINGIGGGCACHYGCK